MPLFLAQKQDLFWDKKLEDYFGLSERKSMLKTIVGKCFVTDLTTIAMTLWRGHRDAKRHLQGVYEQNRKWPLYKWPVATVEGFGQNKRLCTHCADMHHLRPRSSDGGKKKNIFGCEACGKIPPRTAWRTRQ